MAFQPLNGTGNLTTAAVNTGTTIVLNKPANTSDGDVLLAAVFARSNTAVFTTPPTSWVEVAPTGTEITTAGILRWYYKVITSAAGEPASYTWSGGTSGRNTGILFRVTQASTSAFIDVSGNEATATGTTTATLVLPSVSPGTNQDLLVAMQIANITAGGTRGTLSPPGTMAFLGSVGTSTGASDTDVEVDWEALSATGPTGTRTFSKNTGISSGIGYMIALTNPAPSTPLTASLSVSPTTGTVPFTVTGTASASGGTGTAKTYAFAWGDGGTTPTQSSNVATHQYTTAGTYTVTVTVANT